MRFADVIGNASVARMLASMADNSRVAHALLLYENEGSGALPLALAYVQYLCCQNPHDGDSCGECPSCRQISKLIYPDMHFVFPVNKGPKTNDDKPTSESYLKCWRELVLQYPYFTEAQLQKALGVENKNTLIAVAEAQKLISKLSLTSVADSYKSVIFYLPEKMNQETANRLLKIVEEPPEKTIFIFITHSPEKVLQTIFSRCQSIRVLPLSREEAAKVRALSPFDQDEDESSYMDIFSDLMGALMRSDLLLAQEVMEAAIESKDPGSLSSRERQKAFCSFVGKCLRNIFLLQNGQSTLTDYPGQYEDFYQTAARACSQSFCQKTAEALSKTVSLIDRNVNSQILFCDLVNRLYYNMKQAR